MSFPRCDRTAAWAALQGHFQAHGRGLDLREAFAREPARFQTLSFEAPEVFADLSKNLLDAATLHFLLDLAAWRPGATRCWPVSRSISPRAGRCCTPR
jgi:glucose-6-phosphate isomerase